MFPRYLQYLLTDFRQTFVTGASRDRDELIRFWGQNVKGQGHSMTEYIPDFDVSAISPVSVDGFPPNFCRWCISGQRWPDYVLGSKGQSSRTRHRGGGVQHSTLPSSATFSSFISVISIRRGVFWRKKSTVCLYVVYIYILAHSDFCFHDYNKCDYLLIKHLLCRNLSNVIVKA